MKKHIVGKAIPIFCVIIVLLTMIPDCAKGIENIVMFRIIITNSPDEIEMNLTETENLTIDGIVSCEMYSIRYVIVELEVTDTFGSSVIDPASIVLRGSGIQEASFEINARITLLSEGEFNESIRVNGTATVYPGPQINVYIDSVDVNIPIKVINETNNDPPDSSLEEKSGFDNESESIFIAGVAGAIIFVIVIIWIIKRRKQKLLDIG